MLKLLRIISAHVKECLDILTKIHALLHPGDDDKKTFSESVPQQKPVPPPQQKPVPGVHDGGNRSAPTVPLDEEQLARVMLIEEVIAYLCISRRTYSRFVRQGILVPRLLGIRHYYYFTDLDVAFKRSRGRR